MAWGIFPISKRTAVISLGVFQLNLALLAAYHLLGSGWVGDEILGACGTPVNSTGVTDSGAPVSTAPPKLNCAFPKSIRIFVPWPSLASAEPEEKLRIAVPAALTLKFAVINFPLVPLNPGLSAMPSKLTVPALLENDGSCTHKLKMEPVFESEVTSNLSWGKVMMPEAAFIAWSALETYTLTESDAPTSRDPEEGEKYKLAAWTNCGITAKNAKTKMAGINILMRAFFSIAFLPRTERQVPLL